MSTNPHVREVGRVEDLDGAELAVGVDYDAVTIGPFRLRPSVTEEFARLFVAACWEASRQAAALEEASQ